jgi:hypothetical protein
MSKNYSHWLRLHSKTMKTIVILYAYHSYQRYQQKLCACTGPKDGFPTALPSLPFNGPIIRSAS